MRQGSVFSAKYDEVKHPLGNSHLRQPMAQGNGKREEKWGEQEKIPVTERGKDKRKTNLKLAELLVECIRSCI